MRNLFNFILAGFLFSNVAPVFADPLGDAEKIIHDVNQKFRSSDRYIPADVLNKVSFQQIGSDLLRNFEKIDWPTFLRALESSRDSLKLNKGVAENLIKIRKIAELCKGLCSVSDSSRLDQVAGLSQKEIDDLVKEFEEPASGSRFEGEFDYELYEIKNINPTSMLENDWYNIKMAAGYFMKGMHKNTRDTFSMFSRGSKNRAYMVLSGLDQGIDMLENARFTEREIQWIKNHPDMKNVPEEFFEYLRNWRFKGDVRAIRSGDVFFPNETVLEVNADPIDAQLVETKLLEIIQGHSHPGTKAARVVLSADGKLVVEGGTRRAPGSRQGIVGALSAGVNGTSNVHIARIFGADVYGSQAHAWVGHFASELEAFLSYKAIYPGTILIADTFDIENGVKVAVRAAGGQLTSVRLDSNISGMNVEQTVTFVKNLLASLGYGKVKVGLSNRLNEYTINETGKADWLLVGTAIQSPEDSNGLNMVYKLTQRIVTDETGRETIIPVAKLSEDKVGEPGSKQTYRFTGPDGLFTHDIKTLISEVSPGGEALIESAMREGKRDRQRQKLSDIATYSMARVAKLPSAVQDFNARPGIYLVNVSEGIKKAQDQVRAYYEAVNNGKKRVGVFFGSFDPIHESHLRTAEVAKELYNLEKVIFVPTGATPVHGKHHLFSPVERAAFIEREIKNKEGLEVYRGEVESKTKFSSDTLDSIKASLSLDTEIVMIAGEDAFATLWGWHHSEDLISKYSWIVTKRNGGSGELSLPEGLLEKFYDRVEGSKQHMVSREGGHFIELVDFRGPVISSSMIRKSYERVDTVSHQVDTQKTFWKGMHGQVDGPLAVKGTPEITENVATLAELSLVSPRMKAISSMDAHQRAETRNPKLNREFHNDPETGKMNFEKNYMNFPPHGMAGEEGPVGDSRIPEVANVFSKQLIVPHHREIAGDQLELTPFSVADHKDLIRDPSVEVVIQKNGEGSYGFDANKHSAEMIKLIAPKRIVVYGVATDFCVACAVKWYRSQGHEVWLVTDAIAGVFPELTDTKLNEMKDSGVKFVTTAQVVEEYKPTPDWKPSFKCAGAVKALGMAVKL
ncbi:MAG: pncB [Bacteriovoracaceae bacterium]|nr:pncB [Bacteriovoracaceae bacterium]